MLGIDTNVLIRLLVEDDAAQTRKARLLVEKCAARHETVLVSLPVIVEVEWVLRSRYELTKAEIVSAFRALLAAAEFTLEHESALEEALYFWQDAPTGFVDCLIAAHHRRLGCSGTATFDSKALRVPGFVQA
jgi:predicted nucleic-acid-binding protein